MPGPSFFRELRRRKVVQAAAIYGAVAWGVTEVAVTVTEQLFLPQWVSTLAVIGFVVGFPIAMFLAWTFDLTTEGLRRTEIGSRRGTASIAASLLLLIAGTAGLFLLIRPALEDQAPDSGDRMIVPNSVAVLPFESAGFKSEDAWLGPGLSDELRDQLAQISGMRVAARSSSVAAREQGMDAIQAARKLGVAHLVEGTMRRQGNQLRVSVQLIDGASGLTLWSWVFDRGPNELLNIQQEIATEVVRQVLPDSQAVVAEPATRDPSANELLLLARHYEQQVRARKLVDIEILRESVRLYRDAIEADPESAVAHARLAGALLYLGDVDAAEAPVFKALSLNPNLSEVQNTLGEFYWARGLPEARMAFERAVELNPNNADALHNYASALWLSPSHFESGIDDLSVLFRRALELDRLSLARHATLGDFLGKEGRVEETRLVIAEIQDLFDGAEALRTIGWLEELIGEIDRAIAWTVRARDLEPDNPDHLQALAGLFTLIGDPEMARRFAPEPTVGLLFTMRRYGELIDTAELLMIDEPANIDVRYLLAFAYNATEQHEGAIHILSSTGQPDIVLNNRVRSVADLDAFVTLMNALAGTGQAETAELARSLAQWFEEGGWWGDISWISINRSCTLSILDRREEALQQLQQIEKSARLPWDAYLRDTWCMKRYADEPDYREVLRLHEQRQAALRERLPRTLAEFGVTL